MSFEASSTTPRRKKYSSSSPPAPDSPLPTPRSNQHPSPANRSQSQHSHLPEHLPLQSVPDQPTPVSGPSGEAPPPDVPHRSSDNLPLPKQPALNPAPSDTHDPHVSSTRSHPQGSAEQRTPPVSQSASKPPATLPSTAPHPPRPEKSSTTDPNSSHANPNTPHDTEKDSHVPPSEPPKSPTAENQGSSQIPNAASGQTPAEENRPPPQVSRSQTVAPDKFILENSLEQASKARIAAARAVARASSAARAIAAATQHSPTHLDQSSKRSLDRQPSTSPNDADRSGKQVSKNSLDGQQYFQAGRNPSSVDPQNTHVVPESQHRNATTLQLPNDRTKECPVPHQPADSNQQRSAQTTTQSTPPTQPPVALHAKEPTTATLGPEVVSSVRKSQEAQTVKAGSSFKVVREKSVQSNDQVTDPQSTTRYVRESSDQQTLGASVQPRAPEGASDRTPNSVLPVTPADLADRPTPAASAAMAISSLLVEPRTPLHTFDRADSPKKSRNRPTSNAPSGPPTAAQKTPLAAKNSETLSTDVSRPTKSAFPSVGTEQMKKSLAPSARHVSTGQSNPCITPTQAPAVPHISTQRVSRPPIPKNAPAPILDLASLDDGFMPTRHSAHQSTMSSSHSAGSRSHSAPRSKSVGQSPQSKTHLRKKKLSAERRDQRAGDRSTGNDIPSADAGSVQYGPSTQDTRLAPTPFARPSRASNSPSTGMRNPQGKKAPVSLHRFGQGGDKASTVPRLSDGFVSHNGTQDLANDDGSRAVSVTQNIHSSQEEVTAAGTVRTVRRATVPLNMQRPFREGFEYSTPAGMVINHYDRPLAHPVPLGVPSSSMGNGQAKTKLPRSKTDTGTDEETIAQLKTRMDMERNNERAGLPSENIPVSADDVPLVAGPKRRLSQKPASRGKASTSNPREQVSLHTDSGNMTIAMYGNNIPIDRNGGISAARPLMPSHSTAPVEAGHMALNDVALFARGQNDVATGSVAGNAEKVPKSLNPGASSRTDHLPGRPETLGPEVVLGRSPPHRGPITWRTPETGRKTTVVGSKNERAAGMSTVALNPPIGNVHIMQNNLNVPPKQAALPRATKKRLSMTTPMFPSVSKRRRIDDESLGSDVADLSRDSGSNFANQPSQTGGPLVNNDLNNFQGQTGNGPSREGTAVLNVVASSTANEVPTIKRSRAQSFPGVQARQTADLNFPANAGGNATRRVERVNSESSGRPVRLTSIAGVPPGNGTGAMNAGRGRSSLLRGRTGSLVTQNVEKGTASLPLDILMRTITESNKLVFQSKVAPLTTRIENHFSANAEHLKKIGVKQDAMQKDFSSQIRVAAKTAEEVRDTRGEVEAIRKDVEMLKAVIHNNLFGQLAVEMSSLGQRINGATGSAQFFKQSVDERLDRNLLETKKSNAEMANYVKHCVASEVAKLSGVNDEAIVGQLKTLLQDAVRDMHRENAIALGKALQSTIAELDFGSDGKGKNSEDGERSADDVEFVRDTEECDVDTVGTNDANDEAQTPKASSGGGSEDREDTIGARAEDGAQDKTTCPPNAQSLNKVDSNSGSVEAAHASDRDMEKPHEKVTEGGGGSAASATADRDQGKTGVVGIGADDANTEKRAVFDHATKMEVRSLIGRVTIEWILSGGIRSNPPRNERMEPAPNDWVQRMVYNCLFEAKARMAMYKTIEELQDDLARNLKRVSVDVDWLMLGPTTETIGKARGNYIGWDPKLHDYEWKSESRVLTLIAVRVLRAEKDVVPLLCPEDTCLNIAIKVTTLALEETTPVSVLSSEK